MVPPDEVPADVRAFAALVLRARHSNNRRRSWPLLNVNVGLGRLEIVNRMRLRWHVEWTVERLAPVLEYLRRADVVKASAAGGFVVIEWARVEALVPQPAQDGAAIPRGAVRVWRS